MPTHTRCVRKTKRSSGLPGVSMGAAALLLAGCVGAPAPSAVPDPVLPEQWSRAPLPSRQAPIDSAWWLSFGSPELAAVVDAAGRQSLTLAAADARVRQARANARIAGAALLPEVRLLADVVREDRLGHSSAAVDGPTFGIALAASYEIDLWGGNRAARDAARATLQASEFERDTVRLTLIAGVAAAWLEAVSGLERTDIARQNLRSAQQILASVESRHRAGAALALELAQQRSLVAAQRRSLAQIDQQAEEARTVLAQLLGQMVPVALQTQSLQALEMPSLDGGLPSALLEQRPDIARAQARLAAADADVAVARAAMLPTVRLGATIGTGGNRYRSILDDPIYSVAAGLTAPIFDAGRLASGHALMQARREELLADYRASIVSAFADVDTALAVLAGVEARASAQAEELEQARHAVRLADARYRAGADPLLTLLDAQRTFYASQDLSVQLKLLRLQAAVGLYRALGGGWTRPTPADAA